jgi:hypothetical protein
LLDQIRPHSLGRCTYCRRSWFQPYSSCRLLSNSRKISLKFEGLGIQSLSANLDKK